MENLVTIVVAVVGCSAFWQLVQHILESRRKDKFDLENAVRDIQKDMTTLKQNQQMMQTSVDCLSDIVAQNEVINKRVRILTFADDMMDSKAHSKDAFDQVLSDIDDYERYCEKNPRFRNNQTAMSIALIKAQYQEHLENHTFLQWK